MVWQRVEVSAGLKHWMADCCLKACRLPQDVRNGNHAPMDGSATVEKALNTQTMTDHCVHRVELCVSVFI